MTFVEQPPTKNVRRDIGDAVSSLMRDRLGRGPERTRVMIDDQAVVVLMQDVLHQGEQHLVDRGRSDDVLRLRRAFQETLRDELCERIVTILGREVVAFLSTNSVGPSWAAEIFILGGPVAAAPLQE